LEVLAED